MVPVKITGSYTIEVYIEDTQYIHSCMIRVATMRVSIVVEKQNYSTCTHTWCCIHFSKPGAYYIYMYIYVCLLSNVVVYVRIWTQGLWGEFPCH